MGCRMARPSCQEAGALECLVPLSIPSGVWFICLALLFPDSEQCLGVGCPVEQTSLWTAAVSPQARAVWGGRQGGHGPQGWAVIPPSLGGSWTSTPYRLPLPQRGEGGGAQGLMPALKVLHHELLPTLTLHLAHFQASKLRCQWIMTAGESCCICKSLSCIKGRSEQVSAVHMKALLSVLGEAGGGPSWLRAVRLLVFAFAARRLLLEENN